MFLNKVNLLVHGDTKRLARFVMLIFLPITLF